MNPFPAALQDALSSYRVLLNTLHIPPHQIIFAGATLATSLLCYLHEFGSAINTPEPKCAVLLSPWVDPFYYDASDNPHCVPTSFQEPTVVIWSAHSYAGSLSAPKTDPYITSLGNPFPTPVPLFVSAGTAELLFERITQWVKEMRGIEGNLVELHNEEDALHDTYFIADLMGFEESAWDVNWLRRRLQRLCKSSGYRRQYIAQCQ
ncbi:hypothetical protein VMCG_06006 [Cytospora schulzeri]|uniref:Alpha/beta hydrolase fold-3 domain-containing protein n=1 Tax=Cytospora schulzeri TaxID=448051 RepID=A0A423WGM2_9PEZI|nr:hypothetical protein VMCG_06006 [Valsa malicola]